MDDTLLTLEEDIASEVANRCYNVKQMLLSEISRRWDIAQIEPLPMLPLNGIAIRSRKNGEAIAVIRIAKKSIRLYRVLGNNTLEYDEVARLVDQYATTFDYFSNRSLDDNTCAVWMASRIKKTAVFTGERHKEVVPGTILVARIEDSRHILFGTQWFVQVIDRTNAKCRVMNVRGKPCGEPAVPGFFFEYMPLPNVFDDRTVQAFTLPRDSDIHQVWYANLKKGVSLRPWDGKPIRYNSIVGV